MSDFNSGASVKVFNEHGVEYVVIGAFAAIVFFLGSAETEQITRAPAGT